jgi:hypothetical protein
VECTHCSHTPGCETSHLDQDGNPCCIFCLDHNASPILLRLLAQSRGALEMLRRLPAALPNRSISRSALARIAGVASQETKKMATVISSPRPSLTPAALAPAIRKCACGNVLAVNNRRGICGSCQERQGGRSALEPQRSHRKTNGAADTEAEAAKPLITMVPTPGNGDGAHQAPEEISVRSFARSVESRVDLLFAAIPIDDKRKLVCAYLAGTL